MYMDFFIDIYINTKESNDMKWNVKRKVAGFLGALMAISLIMSDGTAMLLKADGPNPGGNDGIEVVFTDGVVSGNDS